VDLLTEKFNIILNGENLIYLYEFLNIIYIIVKKNQLENLLDFFNQMDSATKMSFYKVTFTCGYNAFIVKIYLMFLIKFRQLVLSNNVRKEFFNIF
jgi:hypothetical protein